MSTKPAPSDSIAALVDHIARHLADNGCLLNLVGYVLTFFLESPLRCLSREASLRVGEPRGQL